MKIKIKKKESKYFREKLKREIIDAAEESPELTKEMRRVAQMANRRAQNIEKAGLYSPALRSLEEQGRTGYTKFSISGSWEHKKEEYAKAIAFLNQPTSTATGTREYLKSFAQRNGMDLETAQFVLKEYDDLYFSSPEMQAILERYPSAQQEIITDVRNSGNIMDMDSEQFKKMIQDSINREAEETTDLIMNIIDSGLRMG